MKFFALITLLAVSSVAISDENPVRLPKFFLPVPIVRQATNYSCGPAALLSILNYWQVSDGNESSLYGALEATEQEGTNPHNIAAVAKKYGLKVRFQENSTLENLRSGLASGETAILDIQAWPDDQMKTAWKDRWEDGHYVILIGMNQQYAFFVDPSIASSYTYIALTELMDRWHDYENEKGQRRIYTQLAIFISGDRPRKNYPRELEPTE